MRDIPSRESLAALTRDANAVAAAAMVGIAREREDGRVWILCSYVHGFGAHVVRAGDAPQPFRFPAPGPRCVGADAINAAASGAIKWQLSFGGVQQLFSVPIPSLEPPTLLWVGLTSVEPLTTVQVSELTAVAERSASRLRNAHEPEAEFDRLRRLEAAADLLPALHGVLDVRDVFDRLSTISRTAVPHEVLGLGMLNEDLSQVTVFASAGSQNPPTVFSNRYSDAVVEAWDFHIIDDLTTHPNEAKTEFATRGMRSSLRLPIRLANRIAGGLNFMSAEAGRYTSSDVAIGRRIADHVALALSHHRLADESRRAAALRERARTLEVLDGLLDTLAGVLDIREVFDRVSDIAQKVLPHDAVIIIVPTGEGDRAHNYALRGLGDHPEPIESHVREPALLTAPWDFRIYDDLAVDPVYRDTLSAKAGMHGALLLPVRLAGKLHAFLSFMSREPQRFTRDDVVIGRRIADHIALALSHQRLAEEARRNEELRARTAKADLLDELLASVTGEGDLPQVFERVSDVTQKVLTHDALVLTVVLPDGQHAKVYASKTPESARFPDVVDVPPLMLANPDWTVDLIEDLQDRADQTNLTATQLGYRAALRVPIRFDNEYVAGVSFLSFTRGAYSAADVPVARRIADRIALSFARERGTVLTKRADEAVERASRLEARVRALTEELDARTGYRRVVGDSSEWRQVLTHATQVAVTETTVLLLGESGTGKEVVARFIHRASERKNGPFIALNCAALPEQLLEAELFGYERGAFTGAVQSKPGQLEQAAGGTLFLDEIGEMPLTAQSKILRVLEHREIQRLGSSRSHTVDIRVVAATNQPLEELVQHGRFRSDLFYRLNVARVHLPPLRERKEDIPGLIAHFLTVLNAQMGRQVVGLEPDVHDYLMEYQWPGNIRELRNLLEATLLTIRSSMIGFKDLPEDYQLKFSRIKVAPFQERERLVSALAATNWNISKTAQQLDWARMTVYRKLAQYGLERPHAELEAKVT